MTGVFFADLLRGITFTLFAVYVLQIVASVFYYRRIRRDLPLFPGALASHVRDQGFIVIAFATEAVLHNFFRLGQEMDLYLPVNFFLLLFANATTARLVKHEYTRARTYQRPASPLDERKNPPPPIDSSSDGDMKQ